MSDEKQEATSEGGIGQSASTGGLGAWLPIKTAPKDGTMVLLWADGQVEIGDWLPDAHPWNDGAWWIEGGQITARNPTHWMPLPDAPNVELRGDEAGRPKASHRTQG